MAESKAKQLVKNTILMYVRMGFLIVINLYTSRVILLQLGIEDFGIYNVVGSIVAMFLSFKSIFAASTQRFMNYEMGKGNNDHLQLIYNLSTYINGIIAIIFFVLVEIVGVWFLEYQANISLDRIVAAHWVFQLSVLTTIISIMNTPFDACVIAHERMDFYAYLSIFEGLAKLGICYLLSLGAIDKLILYGILLLLVTICTRIINHTFCVKNFTECHMKKLWNRDYFKKMISYASWAFFGNTAYALAQSGLNMVLNVFGGPIVNAARGIAYQVNAALWNFIANISIVLKPYTVKSYAAGEKEKAFDIAFFASKIYFYIQLMLVVFVAFLADYLIDLWLGQIPAYVITFLDLVLIQSLVRTLQMPLDMLFGAEGNIKYYQLYEGIILFLPVPVSYILLKCGLPYYTVFLSAIFFEILHILGIAVIGKYILGLQLIKYAQKIILPCGACAITCLTMYYWSYTHFNSFVSNIFYMLFTMVIATLIEVFVIFDNSEKQLISTIMKRKN